MKNETAKERSETDRMESEIREGREISFGEIF